MLDILACPIDKHHPLQLHELKTSTDSNTIVDGVLYCTKCTRPFFIIDEIPVMLPDDLRDQEQEKLFLKKYKDDIPPNLTQYLIDGSTR